MYTDSISITIIYVMIFRFFFFKQKTAYEMLRSLVGSEMCIRDRSATAAVVTGLVLALSSTAFALQLIAGRGEMTTRLSLIHI